MSDVLINTILVILLAIVTTVFLHILILRFTRVNIHEGFVSGHPHRTMTKHSVRMLPYDSVVASNHETEIPQGTAACHMNSACENHSPNTQTVHQPVSHMKPHVKNPTISLEDELKQWMQQESSNWAKTSASQLTNTSTTDHLSADASLSKDNDMHKMSTSIEQVFQEQQVNTKDVTIPTDVLSSAVKSPLASADGNSSDANMCAPSSVAYSNTMNSGELGGGLLAYDCASSNYANL